MFDLNHTVLYVLAILILTILVYAVFRRKLVSLINEHHNNFVGAASQNIGTLYCILLAFIVVVSWQSYNAAQDTMTKEAVKIQALWRDSKAFSPENQVVIKNNINAYINNVITAEWPEMKKDQGSIEDQAYDQLWQVYYHIKPHTATEEFFLQASIQNLNQISQERRARILAADSSLPMGLWVLLVMGAICTVMTTMLYEEIEVGLRYTILCMEIILLCIAFYMINSFEHPYSGLAALNSDVYQHALTSINSPPIEKHHHKH